MAEKKKRYAEKQHKTTLRFPHGRYAALQQVAKQLGMSVAGYINTVLVTDGVLDLEKEVMAIRRRQYSLYMDTDTEKSINELSSSLNGTARQLRMLGTNVSALIRDIRTGKVAADKNTVAVLTRISEQVTDAAESVRETAGKLDKRIGEIPDPILSETPYINEKFPELFGTTEGDEDNVYGSTVQ